MYSHQKFLAHLLIILLLVPTSGFAENIGKPLWEAGIGLFASTFPAYRGSNDQQYLLLPFPYFIYRGEKLKVERGTARAQLFESDRVQLNISLSAAIPAKSDAGNARQDMPDLDTAFQIGPSLNIRLAKPAPNHALKLKLPIRPVIATDFHSNVESIGWVFQPHLNLESRDLWGGWNTGLNIGVLFAGKNYHDYYYGVQPEFVTPTRRKYTASSGYSGGNLVASFRRRFDRLWVGGFMRVDYLNGAVFDDSPLLDTEYSIMAGVGIAWVFQKSAARIH